MKIIKKLDVQQMEVIDTIDESKNKIIDSIKKYGFMYEHNYWSFYNQSTAYAKPFFFRFDGSCGILSLRYKSGVWEMIGEILAPEEERLELFSYFLEYVLITKNDKKVLVTIPEKFYQKIIAMLKKSDRYRITKPVKTYLNPVFSMEKWDKNLTGKRWKKLRNIKNRFLKSYNVETIPSNEVNKEKLIDIVLKWRKYRPRINKTYYTQMYINFIKNNFEGADMSWTILINGEPCTITAGWSIPNSENYYSAIGLYNYKYIGLGELANIDDLNKIKEKGYKYADFGYSGDSLLQFKKKFGPEYYYTTYYFYIVKK